MPQSHLVVWRLRLPSFQMLSPVQAVLRVISLPSLIQLFKLSLSNELLDKAEVKAKAHADIRQRIVRFLAAPAFPTTQLTDEQLMHQAFQVLTIDNVGGTLHLADGSLVSMRQCIDEFAVTS